ncbi:acetylglutamate kinase [Aerococcaceae bacterium DSM 111176]|nr:acetylglutamate kinase [Aerococcaceae bacterium DSM 111176]
MAYEKVELANVLIEALPYVNRFRGHKIVIKYGGNAMINEDLKTSVMQDLHLMHSVGMHPILIHGGGPMISNMMERLGKPSVFIEGLRVTDDETMAIAEMVLAGQVNPDIVGKLNHIGGRGVGLSGKDGNLIRAKKIDMTDDNGNPIDLGNVGEVVSINQELIDELIRDGYIPVISSVGMDDHGQALNINADYVASAVAESIQADKFVLLTDVAGVFRDFTKPETLISQLTLAEIDTLINEEIISGGMLPKIQCVVEALKGGVTHAHIVDGRVKHSLLLEIFFDEGIGTMVTH